MPPVGSVDPHRSTGEGPLPDMPPPSTHSGGGSAFVRYLRARCPRPSRNRPLALAGYFGWGNAGDNAIQESLEAGLSHRIEVLPLRQTRAGAVGRVGGWAGILRQIRAIRRSRGLIFGGGGLLKAAGGGGFGASLLEPAMAIALGRPVFGVGLGVDRAHPRGPHVARLDRNVLRAFERITVRDRRSHQALEAVGIQPTVTADIAWAHPGARRPSRVEARSGIALVLSQHGVLLGSGGGLAVHLGDAIRELELLAIDHGGLDQLAFCRNAQVDDLDVATRDRSPRSAQLTDVSRSSFTEVLDIVGKRHLLIGMRYHSLLAGVLCQVPVIALGGEEKVVTIARQFGIPNFPIDGNLVGNLATELGSVAASGFQPNYDTSIAARLAGAAETDLLELDGTLDRPTSPPNYRERMASIRFLCHLIWTLGIGRSR